MAERAPSIRSPSLLDRKSTGGIHAGEGFSVQERYVALAVVGWLKHPAFERFQPERAEDVDAWFDGEREHHQVKIEHLAQGDVAELLEVFQERFRPTIEQGRLRRYVIAAAYLGGNVRSFIKNLEIYRSRHFDPTDDAERAATDRDLTEIARKAKLEAHLPFILRYVDFERDLSALEGRMRNTRHRLAMGLAELLDIKSVDESTHVAGALLTALHDDRTRSWSRADLMAELHGAQHAFRSRSARPAGDLLLIRHETLKKVHRDPTRDDAPALFGERRPVLVKLDDVEALHTRDPATIGAAAAALVKPDGPFVTALDAKDARSLYYGFPHVPFGMLAGYVAGPHRAVSVLEHDLESCRFEWRGDSPLIGTVDRETIIGAGSAARLRIGISARVQEAPCELVLRRSALLVDLQVESAVLGRGIVTSEAQARHFAAHVRRLLDATIAGDPRCTSLHVFAAVPVSVAFLVGQVLAHSTVPACYVYNFSATSTPQYGWRLGLRETTRGQSCVELLSEVTDDAA